MWSWAVHNVAQDIKERDKLLFSFMESLTWWLQPELKGKVERERKNQWPDVDLKSYAQGLREGGASEEYVAAEIAKITEERKRKRDTDELLGREAEDDGDEIQILRGPDK